MSSTSKPGRKYCATCGWPLGAARCEACGGDGVPLALADSTLRFVHEGGALDPRLDRAFDAFKSGDYAGMVTLCLGAEPTWTSRAVTAREGPAWILTIGDAFVFLSIDTGANLLVIESPLVKLPERHRVAAMRYCLETAANEDDASRVCLRGDLLVQRFAQRLAAVSPSVLFAVVANTAASSEHALAELVIRFDATAAIPSDRRGLPTWDVLGKARALTHLAPPILPRPEPLRAEDPPALAVPESIPPIFAPSFASQTEDQDSIPAILAPSFASQTEDQDSIPAILAVGFASGASSTRKSSSQIAAVAPSSRRPTLNGLRIEAPRRGNLTPPPMPAVSPEAERLCELLRSAQSLATGLSFEQKPMTMLILVRATVFRAVHAHGEALPDAVATLYRGAGAAVKEIWPSNAPKSQAEVPMAEPALLAMERIVSMNAHVPQEPPVSIEPLTSAAQAKEHLSRYLVEIEKAPPDPKLRHFLALGALAELLVRTKLPPQTQQRLREIVLYAHRGDKQAESTDLMMTALGRIVAP